MYNRENHPVLNVGEDSGESRGFNFHEEPFG